MYDRIRSALISMAIVGSTAAVLMTLTAISASHERAEPSKITIRLAAPSPQG